MTHLILLLSLLVVVSSSQVNIKHVDKDGSEANSYVSKDEGEGNEDLFYTLNRDDDGAWYLYQNRISKKAWLRRQETKGKDDKIIYLSNRFTNGEHYRFSYSTTNETTREEDGNFKEDADGSKSLEVEGTYSYIGENNVRYIISYTADKNGYRPKVLFGTKVEISESGIRSQSAPAQPQRNIDGTLLCSLIGGGCRRK